MAESFLSPLRGTAGIGCVLRDGDSGTIVAERLETAFDSRSRRRGLLGRTVFPAGSALIIAPCASVHTWFMRIVIDVAFVSRDGRVLKLCPELRAWRVAFACGAFAVIEMPRGTIARTRIERGHHVLITSAPA